MAKKIVVGAVATVVLGVFLFGTRFFGYVGSGVDAVKQAANDAVPFEMKVKEAKKIVGNVDDAIEKLEKQMAITMAERDAFEKSAKQTDERIVQMREDLTYLASVLDQNDSEYVFVNTSNGKQKKSVVEVKNKLKSTLASFNNAKKSAATDKDSRDREQKKYEGYQKQHAELVAKKEKLIQRIKELEANQVALETRKAVEATKIDDSVINEAEEFLNDLEKDQAVQNNLLNIQKNDGGFDVEPNAEDSGDLLEDVKKALEEDGKPSELISTES